MNELNRLMHHCPQRGWRMVGSWDEESSSTMQHGQKQKISSLTRSQRMPSQQRLCRRLQPARAQSSSKAISCSSDLAGYVPILSYQRHKPRLLQISHLPQPSELSRQSKPCVGCGKRALQRLPATCPAWRLGHVRILSSCFTNGCWQAGECQLVNSLTLRGSVKSVDDKDGGHSFSAVCLSG